MMLVFRCTFTSFSSGLRNHFGLKNTSASLRTAKSFNPMSTPKGNPVFSKDYTSVSVRMDPRYLTLRLRLTAAL